ncbi:hypothetical protein [Parasulfitobacter algicola]|uniref:N-acetyltransferase domain-containing protein n=1 Tax=Parasulfitobacter algicola TaxID=2614809 RepID=A0ABX2ILP4_9RHOB|nr:hypothetical protein [Sulfitobacter algicola]NSX53787.1 hypothetical protein [Sulfitobacter algicola]
MTLCSKIIPKESFTDQLICGLFDIYRKYYNPADLDVFHRDFNEKAWVIILSDPLGKLCGFSTIDTWLQPSKFGPIRILYSGDTVIERDHWGQQILPFSWIEHAGSVKRAAPDIPLYWLLISKGHRTFRYLPAFTYSYYPTPDCATPPDIVDLITAVGHTKFSNTYDPNTGLVRPKDCASGLLESFDGLDPGAHNNKYVRFFLEKNPDFAKGDELLCLCELSHDNLKPMARKQFEKGYSCNGMVITA